MTADLMNGIYYEITGGMSEDTIKKAYEVTNDICSIDFSVLDRKAKAEAINTERVAYRNTYKNGKRIESIKIYDPYDDAYYSVNTDQLYYEPLPKDMQYRYFMLGRLKNDCDYFLGNGYGYEGHLWAKTVEGQIKEMRDRWNSFEEDEKPEWLTMEQINEYEKNMLYARESRKKAIENLEPGTSYSLRWEVANA